MKVGIVSDTHNNISNLNKAIEFLRSLGAEKYIHLGDDYADVDEIGEGNVMRVPGVFSEQYQQSDIPNRRIEHFLGWRVLLTHTREAHEHDRVEDVNPDKEIRKRNVDIVLYGHTHVPDICDEGGLLLINPGHLKDEDKKGYPPTCGYMELTENNVVVRIYRLEDGMVYKEIHFRRV